MTRHVGVAATGIAVLGCLGPVVIAAGEAAARGRVADRIRGQAIAAAHPPMEAPTVLPAARARHMREEDVVLGIVVGGEARAYPWWIAKNFHAVNDTVRGVPVVVTLCEQCTGAAAFGRALDGRVLTFEVAGVYNGTIIARDRETATLWAPFSGKGLEGPLAGRKLERIPLAMTRWSEWKTRHPATGVLWGPEQVRGGHGSWYEPGKWGIVGEMGATIGDWDTRLPENVLVYGADLPGGRRAYPLPALKAQGVVNDSVAGVPVVVLASGELEAAGFDRRVGARTLTFRGAASGGAVMEDGETGSAWSADGVAVRGPLLGERLAPLDGYVVEWHVWAAYNPDTGIFGGAPAAGHEVAGDVAFPALHLAAVDGTAPQPVSPRRRRQPGRAVGHLVRALPRGDAGAPGPREEACPRRRPVGPGHRRAHARRRVRAAAGEGVPLRGEDHVPEPARGRAGVRAARVGARTRRPPRARGAHGPRRGQGGLRPRGLPRE
jgi:hypothetical protein